MKSEPHTLPPVSLHGVVVPCSVGYRRISLADAHTPLSHLPMQRMTLDVEEPCGTKEAIDAVMEYFGGSWFQSRDEIRDVEIVRHNSAVEGRTGNGEKT